MTTMLCSALQYHRQTMDTWHLSFHFLQNYSPELWWIAQVRNCQLEWCHCHHKNDFLETDNIPKEDVLQKPTMRNMLFLLEYDDQIANTVTKYTLCLKKVPTFILSVTLSNLNQFSKFLHCWKACENCYKNYTRIPNSP